MPKGLLKRHLLQACFAIRLVLPAGLIATEAHAQGSAAAARREDLASVQEKLADPDPMMRLANMEEIVASGDTMKQRLAMRIAFTSDDAELRGLAMRAYIASRKRITFDVQLPPVWQKQYDDAKDDPKKVSDLTERYPILRTMTATSFRFTLIFADFDMKQDTGKVNDQPFTVIGDEMSSQPNLPGFGWCYVNFRPGRKQTLDGTLACPQWPKFVIAAAAF